MSMHQHTDTHPLGPIDPLAIEDSLGTDVGGVHQGHRQKGIKEEEKEGTRTSSCFYSLTRLLACMRGPGCWLPGDKHGEQTG